MYAGEAVRNKKDAEQLAARATIQLLLSILIWIFIFLTTKTKKSY